MIATNVTHGRPYRLPQTDRDERLFFNPETWRKFFPDTVMHSLWESSDPYVPLSKSDPSMPAGAEQLRELPRGKLPIVVAARLSLSYPLLFSTVPLYAIDYEESDVEKRKLRLCRFSDGGLCSNFPGHFFDCALPRWPTFGLSLEERNPTSKQSGSVWLPEYQGLGRTDSWFRLEHKDTKDLGQNSGKQGFTVNPESTGFGTLFKFLWYAFLSAKDWRDRTAIRIPHVRRRVVRLYLKSY